MTREEVNGLDERIKELKLQHQEAERINLKNKAGELLVDINYLEELRELRNKQEPCEDCISRQAAIRLAEQGQIQGFMWQIQKLIGLPPVQPRQDWIPVTERLPDKEGKYFVMYRERKEKIICVGVDYFMQIDGKLDFWCFDVIKWMPIPEYKENKE